MNRLSLYLLALILMANNLLNAENNIAPLDNKSRFGLGYDIAIDPKFGRFVGEGKDDLKGLYRGFLMVEFPFNSYFSAGVSLDYTLAVSKKNKDPRLSISKDSSRLMTHFLGASARLLPQWPVKLNNIDVILYADIQTGLGTSSPIFFGTQPLSDYEYKGTTNIPSPFPLYLETSLKLGAEIFSWRFLGLDLGYGYRTLWIVHPMVRIEEHKINANMTKDDRSAIWYDISSMFLELGLRFAF